MGKAKKPVKRKSWKTEYYKLAQKVSDDFEKVLSNLSGGSRRKSPEDVADDLDKLAYKYRKLAKKI